MELIKQKVLQLIRQVCESIMVQEVYPQDNLRMIIEFLNYHGPLFIRAISDLESANQKKVASISASISL